MSRLWKILLSKMNLSKTNLLSKMSRLWNRLLKLLLNLL
jgi:hypothetical protein